MKYTLLLFFSFIFFVGCKAVYVPNVRNTPLFSGKGEAQGSFAMGINGFDLQAAGALTDHVAIIASYAPLIMEPMHWTIKRVLGIMKVA